MRALCMCLVLLLSSCASIDRALKATFTPSPPKMPAFYTLDEEGFYQYPEGYTADFTTDFDEYQEPPTIHCQCPHGHHSCD